MKRMKLLYACHYSVTAAPHNRLWWSVPICASKAFPGLIFHPFATHSMICCCEPLHPITCWISEHRDVLAGALGGLSCLHQLSLWEEQDAVRRHLLGNRIRSKCFCKGYVGILIYLQALKPTIFSPVFQWS